MTILSGLFFVGFFSIGCLLMLSRMRARQGKYSKVAKIDMATKILLLVVIVIGIAVIFLYGAVLW